MLHKKEEPTEFVPTVSAKEFGKALQEIIKKDTRIGELEECLRKIMAGAPNAIRTLRKHGYVFESLDEKDELGRWQKLAFRLYSDLVEQSRDAAIALDGNDESEPATRELNVLYSKANKTKLADKDGEKNDEIS